MNKVSVEFTRISDGIKQTRFVMTDDIADKYDVMTEFENTLDFGYIISKIEVVEGDIRVMRLDVNIAKDYRKYSSEELRSYAYSGNLEVNGYDLSDFLEHLFQGMVSQGDLDKAVEEAEMADTAYCAECGEMM